MHYLGEEGYVDYARRTMQTKQRLVEGLIGLGMKPWDTDLCILLFETVDVPAVIDPLAEDVVDDYLRDLQATLRRLRAGKTEQRGDLGYAD